jgi:hypothetical protein
MKTQYKLVIANAIVTGTAQDILACEAASFNLENIEASLARIARGDIDSITYHGYSPTDQSFSLCVIEDKRAQDLFAAFMSLTPSLRQALADTMQRYIAITYNNVECPARRFQLHTLAAFGLALR